MVGLCVACIACACDVQCHVFDGVALICAKATGKCHNATETTRLQSLREPWRLHKHVWSIPACADASRSVFSARSRCATTLRAQGHAPAAVAHLHGAGACSKRVRACMSWRKRVPWREGCVRKACKDSGQAQSAQKPGGVSKERHDVVRTQHDVSATHQVTARECSDQPSTSPEQGTRT